MEQQITTFQQMFSALSMPGIYLVEDLHTSYWDNYGGGYKRPGTFIEYSKDLIDQINAWYSRDSSELPISDFTKTVLGMHYYDSVLVIEKSAKAEPRYARTGTPSFPNNQ